MKRQESQNVEYKRSWHDEYLRWVCGFANAKGGTIWIGIDDDKSVVGVTGAKKLMEDIPNKIKDMMGLVVDVSLVKKQRKDVLRIDVPESDFPVAYHGEYHYRTGSTKQQLTGFALTQFLFHKMHLSWDAVETVNKLPFAKYPFKIFVLRYEKRTGKDFKKSWFASMGLCTKGGVLTNAGALFSDECPIPQSRVFCTLWNGLTKSRDAANDKEFSGGVIELLDAAELFIKSNTRKAWRKRPHDRVNYPDYPERAVTEALVNAFVHRDYTIAGSEVHVDIYPDRMEIVSPGGMPDGSLVQDLDWRNVPSDRRNPVLADVFGDMDYMERKGSGFGLILDAYEKEAQNPRGRKPSFVSAVGSFRVILPNLNYEFEGHEAHDDIHGRVKGGVKPTGITGLKTSLKTGLEVLEAGATTNDPVTEKVTEKVIVKVTGNQRAIIDFLSVDSSLTQMKLSEKIGISRRHIASNIRKLIDMGCLRRVGSDKGGHWEVIGMSGD